MRRTDFSGDDEARIIGAALRLTAEAGQLLSIWRQSPLRVLARLHLVAAAERGDAVGRPRRDGETADEPLVELPLPDADAVMRPPRRPLPTDHRGRLGPRPGHSGGGAR